MVKSQIEKKCGAFSRLSEHNVNDDLCAYVGVEACGELATLHVQFLTEYGGGELHVECLVAYGEVFCVTCYHGAHDLFPCLYEAVLIERSLEALLSEELAKEVAYGFGVGASHAFGTCVIDLPMGKGYR